jgi:hypothetical protein
MRHPAFVALPALAMAVLEATAAASPTSRLVYSRAPEASSCPDETELRKSVAARFGYDPFFPWAKQTVVVQISRARARYTSRVQLLDEQGIAHGMREFSSNQVNCSEIFQATALAVAIALDAPATPPTQDAPAEEKASPPPPPPPKPAEPAPTVPPPATPPTADLTRDARVTPLANAAPRVRFDVGLDVLGSINRTPLVTPGISAFARARLSIWSLALELRGDWPESAARSDKIGGGSVQAWLIAGGLAPCLHVAYLAFCAVAELGSLQAAGQDVDPRFSKAALFLAAGARLEFEWPLSTTWSVRARVDGVANLYRATLVLGSETVWPAPLFAGTLGAGLAAHFE